MKKKQILILSMLWLATALNAYSQNNLDTICLNTNTAKKLLFYKLEYFRLDTLSRGQQYALLRLDSIIMRQTIMFDLCTQQKKQLQQTADKQLQQCRLQIKKIKIAQPTKPTIWRDIKKYVIGAILGAVIYKTTTN